MKEIYKVNNCNVEGTGKVRQWSRITSTKTVLTMLALLMVALFGVNVNAWGLEQYVTVTDFDGSTEFKDGNLDKVSNGTFKNSANYVDFTIGNISSYQSPLGSRLVYGSMGKNASKSSAFGWSTTSTNYDVSVSRIDIQIVGYQPATTARNAWAKFGDGSELPCPSNGLNYQPLSVSGSLGTGINLNLRTGEQGYINWGITKQYVNTEFCVNYIKFTYKVTHKEYLFGFSATTGVDNASYGSAEATVDNEIVQAAVGKTSASTTATFSATPYDGYAFAGWYTTSTCTGKAESTSNPYKPTVNNSTAGSTVTKTLYAKFVPVEVSSAGSASAVSFNHPETKTVTLYFPVSTFADANADFNSPTITANKVWTIKSWNLNTSTHKVEVVCQFVANSDVVKGAYEATVTLNAKSNNSNTGTVTANVDLTPTLTYKNSSVLISVNDEDKFVINVDTLRMVYKGADNVAGDGAITYALKTASDVASITSAGVFYAKAHGEYTIVASAAKGRYYAKTAEFDVVVGKRTPTFTWKSFEHIYASAVLENVAQAKYGNANVDGLEYSYTSANTDVVVVDGTTLRVQQTGFNEATDVEITVKTKETDYYKKGEAKHTYKFEPKATPVFLLNDKTALPASPVHRLDLLIGETASMAFTNTDESNGNFEYPIAPFQFVKYEHNSGNHTGVITGIAYGDKTIQFHQKGTNTIFDHDRSIHVYVHKHEVELTTTLDGGIWKVDSVYTGVVYGVNVPGEGEPAQNTVTVKSSNENVLKPVDGGWKAVGAGEATLTIAQINNDYWTGDTITATITVEKYDPVFDWSGLRDTLNFNTLYKNPVTSSFTGNPVTYTSNNNAVKVVNDTILQTATTASNAVIITASQVGNYKYNDYSDTKTIKVLKLRNHVEINVTSSETYSAVYAGKQGDVVWDNSKGIRLGGSKTGVTDAPAWDWSDKYVDIKFEGIPKKLSFTTGLTASTATATVVDTWPFSGTGNTNGFWYVIEYSTTGEAHTIWTESSSNNPGNKEFDLLPSTNKVRICYTGNFAGYVKNLKITERTELTASKDTVKFGDNHRVGDNATEGLFTIDWYNLNPLSVTSDNAKFEVITNEVTSKKDSFSTKVPIRVRYLHTSEGTNDIGKITVTNAVDGKKVEVVVIGKTLKREQAIDWLPDYEGETPVILGGDTVKLATATSGLKVTYVSLDNSIAEVIDDTLVYAKALGEVTIKAQQAGNDSWYAAEEISKTFRVTQKVRQIIAWDQNLTRLNPEAEVKRDTLRARVMVANAETGELEEVPSQTAKITYEITGASGIVSLVNDSIITFTTTEGSTSIRAFVPEDETYAAASQTKPVRVRKPANGCEDQIIPNDQQSGFEFFTLNLLEELTKEVTLDRTKGEPGEFTFFHRGENYVAPVIHTNHYKGEIQVYQKVNNAWSEEPIFTVTPAIDNSVETAPVPLDRRATHLKFVRPAGGQGYHYIESISVFRKKYIESETSAIELGTINRGDLQNVDVTVNYSDCKSDLVLSHKDDQLSLKQGNTVIKSVSIECGEVNHFTMRVTVTPDKPGDFKDTIVIADTLGGLELAIPVSAFIKKSSQNITWNQDTAVLTTANLTLNASATSNGDVTYSVVGSSDVASVNATTGVVTIKTSGKVTIRATQAGNDYYDSVYIDKTFAISKVKPSITTVPTAATMTLPNTNLANCVLSNGEANVAGSFAWEDESINATYNNSGYKVVFTPANTNWYDTASCVVVVPVNKQVNVITWNFNVTEMYCNAEYTFTGELAATATSGLAVRYETSSSSIAYVDDAKNLKIVKGGEVTITAYEDGDGTYAAAEPVAKTFTINRFAPTIVTYPSAKPMKIGRTLSDATLTGGRAELNNVKVDGSFAWVDANTTTMSEAGTFSKQIIFTPSNDNYYEPVYGMLQVKVEKYAPVIEHTLHGSDITYGQALTSSTISGALTATDTVKLPNVEVAGTYAWLDPSAVVNAGNPNPTTALVRFSPENTDWYDAVDFEVPLNVAKAAPVLNVTASDIVIGQKLSQSHLTNDGTSGTSGTCAWDPSLNAETTVYNEEGDYANLPYVFTSTDPNYTNGTGVVTLHVNVGFVFNGNADGDWTKGSNWQDGNQPGTTDNVLVNADVEIDGPITVGSLTIAEGVDVTVKDGGSLTINGASLDRTTYGNIHVENGGSLTCGGGEVKVNNFTLDAKLGNTSTAAASGQVNGGEQLNIKGDVYFQLEVDPCGYNTYGWYDFVVPFEVDVIGGISIAEDPTAQMKFNVNYAVMSYDESKRAVNGKDWNKFSGTMEPGRVYTITLDETKPWNTVVFKKKKGAAITGDRSFTTAYSGLGETVDNGWNGFGNGSLFHAELDVPEGTVVQIYDHANRCYQPHAAKDYSIAVGTSFFMQVDGVQTITLDTADNNNGRFMAPKRTRKTVDKFNLSLLNYDDEMELDHMWVGANEDATEAYVIGSDVLKMGTLNAANIARMWTTKGGYNLCAVEAALINDQANTSLSIYAPKAGSYWFAINEAPEDATLYLTHNGNIVWDLTISPYLFDLSKGTTEGYGLRIETKKAPAITTDIEQSETSGQSSVRKVLIDNKVYIVTQDGKMYDVIGKGMKF